MALLFTDGFDHYATAALGQKWELSIPTVGSTTVTVGAYGRNSTNGIRYSYGGNNGTFGLIRELTPSGSTVIVGTAFKAASIGAVSSRNAVFTVYDGTTAQFTLRLNGDGSLSIVRGTSNGTVVATSASVIGLATYYYVEAKVLLSTTVGTYNVQVNGSSVLSGTGANTAGAATTTCTKLGFFVGDGGNLSQSTWDIDDVYVCDGSGSVNNDFLGPIRVVTVLPDGAGTHTDFTPSAGSNFQNVDETATDGDTTYNSSTTAGAIDTYTFGALGVTGTVLGVQANLMIRSAGSGSETIRPKVRLSATDYNGTTVGISTSYGDSREVFETSPDTATAWTTTEIDGAEFGIELVS